MLGSGGVGLRVAGCGSAWRGKVRRGVVRPG